VLIGSKDEIDVTNDVVTQMKHKPVVLTGKTTLDQITAVLGWSTWSSQTTLVRRT
jgi:hypothetical protein